MLSFAKISADSSYYLDGESYYTRDSKPAFSEWFGQGAERLGLKGTVTAAALNALYEGELPNGECIARNLEGKRRPGYDLTFSLPKSLSQLLLAGGDYRIYGVFQAAIKSTIKEMEKDHAQARVTVDGKVTYENTGNLTVALVNHFTSRAGDPQGHCHALFLNNTQTADGKWRALASSSRVDKSASQGFFEAMFAKRSYYEACFNASLAKGSRALGLTPVSTGNHSHFEVAEVPEAARRVHSKRREQIEDALAKYSYASAKMGDVAALATRPDKVLMDPEQTMTSWRAELASSVNFSISAVTREYMGKVGLTPMVLSEAVATVPKHVMVAPANVTIESDASRPQQQAALAKTSLPFLQQAITDLSGWRVAFSMESLTERVLRAGQGEVTLAGVKAGLEALLANGTLLPAGKKGGHRLTTQANLAAEAQVKQQAQVLAKTPNQLRQQKGAAPDRAHAELLASPSSLAVVNVEKADQRAWLQTLLQESDTQRQSVRVLMPTRIQTVEGNQSIKREASNLIGWLMNQFKAPPCETVAGYLYRAAEQNRSKPQLLIVEEANRLRLPNAKALLDQATASGSKLVLLNHEKGQGSRGGSDVMTLLKEADIASQTINQAAPSPSPRVTVVDAKAGLQTGGNPAIQIITDRKKQVAPLTETARQQYREAGHLGEKKVTTSSASLVFVKSEADYRVGQTIKLLGRYSQDICITRIDQDRQRLSWTDHRDREGSVSFAKLRRMSHLVLSTKSMELSSQDKVIGTFNDRQTGVVQGQRYQVSEIGDKRLILTDGKTKLTLRHDQGYLPLDYDYVRTLDTVGHATAEKVIFDARPWSLSSNHLKRLSEVSADITILAENVPAATKRLAQAQTPQTAMALVLDAANSSGAERQLFTPATFQRATEFLRTTHNVPVATAEAAIHYAMEKSLEKNAGVPLKLDNQVFSNLLIFILRLIAKINDLRGVDVKTVRIHQKT